MGRYNAAKAWVTAFTEGLAGELRGHRRARPWSSAPASPAPSSTSAAAWTSARIPDWLWLAADQVVDAALADLARGGRVSVPDRPLQGRVARSRRHAAARHW